MHVFDEIEEAWSRVTLPFRQTHGDSHYGIFSSIERNPGRRKSLESYCRKSNKNVSIQLFVEVGIETTLCANLLV